MRLRTLLHMLDKLAAGMRGRCPNCAYGRLFVRGFLMRQTCPYCGVRFSRARGEMLGAVYLNTSLTLALALLGFFVTDRLFQPPMMLQLVVWTGFCFVFPLLFFRSARGLWVAVAYLTGGVYADPDYEREWINPTSPPVPTRQPWAED